MSSRSISPLLNQCLSNHGHSWEIGGGTSRKSINEESEAENRHGASAVDLCEVVWPLVEVGGGQPSLEVKCDMRA